MQHSGEEMQADLGKKFKKAFAIADHTFKFVAWYVLIILITVQAQKKHSIIMGAFAVVVALTTVFPIVFGYLYSIVYIVNKVAKRHLLRVLIAILASLLLIVPAVYLFKLFFVIVALYAGASFPLDIK